MYGLVALIKIIYVRKYQKKLVAFQKMAGNLIIFFTFFFIFLGTSIETLSGENLNLKSKTIYSYFMRIKLDLSIILEIFIFGILYFFRIFFLLTNSLFIVL